MIGYRWSGITAEALDPVTTTFEEVQTHILNLLSASPTPVLLGHSLESDLKALKICHPLCIDTSVMYHHPRGRPFKPGLAWLTKKWCGREIQNRGEGGHDPEEDARACIDLLKKKIDNGIDELMCAYRLALTSGPLRSGLWGIQDRHGVYLRADEQALWWSHYCHSRPRQPCCMAWKQGHHDHCLQIGR